MPLPRFSRGRALGGGHLTSPHLCVAAPPYDLPLPRYSVPNDNLEDQAGWRRSAAFALRRLTRLDETDRELHEQAMARGEFGKEVQAREEREDDEDESSEEEEADEPSGECEDDRCNGPEPPIWHCVDCDSSYCRYVAF